jgi:hypothetical protein
MFFLKMDRQIVSFLYLNLMCRTQQHINNSLLWNWDGNRIEPDTLIKNCRTVTGTNVFYNVDIREFITSTDNRIIKKVLEGITEKLPPAHKEKFLSRKENSFDFRVDVIKEYISKHIAYYRSSHDFDAWLFPQETVTLKRGDCEDRAFLMASLMIASGISKYVVRVAFGKISDNDTGEEYDHVWIMYKNEKGIWQLIEPISYSPLGEGSKSSSQEYNSATKSYLYKPDYVMNCDHLWSINSSIAASNFPEYLKTRSFWKGFSPAFGYKIHMELVNSAIDADDFKSFLKKANLQDELLTLVSLDDTPSVTCLNQFAYQVSNVDISLSYEPRLHFDNALIKESFDMMKNNMNARSLKGLARAFHSLGDFYAHSSFGCFAGTDMVSGNMELFETSDINNPGYPKQFKNLPDYGSGIFDIRNFSTNNHLYNINDNKAQAIDFWKDKVVSGRFGQSHDSQALLEYTQFWPKGLKETTMQGALPHHNEIAVDGPVFDFKKHKLFKTEPDYTANYELRKNAAIHHISKKFDEWKSLF